MKKLIASVAGLVLLFASSIFAQPTIEEIVAAKGTYTGKLQQKNGGADWACTVTVNDKGVVHVKWSDKEETYKGEMGPAGGKAGNPIVMNGKGADASEVRFQWGTLDELQVEWWPNMEAKAGQTEHKPAHVKGIVIRKN